MTFLEKNNKITLNSIWHWIHLLKGNQYNYNYNYNYIFRAANYAFPGKVKETNTKIVVKLKI